MLANRRIVLGVTGGIAAFKVAELASQLTKAGAQVDVIMTQAATEFVGPLTFQALTQRPVTIDMFRLLSETSIAHVSLGAGAEIVVVAPATANVIAKIAAGLADDMLTTTILATRAPILIAPAMEENMLTNSITQENIARLKERGVSFVDSGYGRLASGKIGQGRMAEVEEIMAAIRRVLARGGDLAGKKVVITAGGTREPIDPVRFIGNRSSGKMGFALADGAVDRGAQVTLITTVTPTTPRTYDVVREVETVGEMRRAVLEACEHADVLIMAAAVSDFRMAQPAKDKIKKTGGKPILELVENDDFLLELSDGFVKVGFAAETRDLLENAEKKLIQKRLDFICANDVTAPDAGFAVDTNRITILHRSGHREELPLMSKRAAADEIFDRVVSLLPSR